jgi:hypothetical protein
MAARAIKTAPVPDTLMSLHREMGEVTAVARSIGHAVNNISAKVDGLDGKVDGLALVVAEQGHLRADVVRLEESLNTALAEIAALKATALRREGAVGLIEWCVKNYPLIVALTGLGVWIGFSNGSLG